MEDVEGGTMTVDPDSSQTRRDFLGWSVGVPAALVAAGVIADAAGAAAQSAPLQPTPSCGDGGPVTPSQTEGPYFKPSSPPRTSLLEPGVSGPRILVEGFVLGTDCRPIPRVLLDFWQADAQGRYDTTGFRLRGHQLTNDAGRYRLESVVPGLYPGRTRHFHVKVQAPGERALTTQLYFPGEPANQRDSIFNPALVMKIHDAEAGKVATFDFVLNVHRRAPA
jgi:protocatechuate 3,4-dioxygenase beta subunit